MDYRRVLKQIVLAAAALAAAAGLSFWVSYGGFYPEAAFIGQGAKSFDELSKRFLMLAEQKGAVYAFDVLKRAPLPPNTDLHLLGHVVGEVLYKQKGPSGIADCTQDFRNACSHSVVIGIMNEYGPPGAVPLIKEACKKAPGGPGAYTMCFHGLGHGVFAYFGYSFSETISYCRQFATQQYQSQEYTECVGGSVMELMGGGGHDPEKWRAARKKYLTDNPLSPCMDSVIPQDVRDICLIYLTPRLMELAGADLGNPSPETFPTAFRFCEAIPAGNPTLRSKCFGGFGKEFIPLVGSRDIRDTSGYSDAQFKTVLSWCKIGPSAEAVDACITGAVSSIFWGGENDPDGALRFCSLAQEVGVGSACYKQLAVVIERYTPERQKRDALCDRLPDTFRSSCQSEEGRLEERTQAEGGKAAYEEFAASIKGLSIEKQHTLAHQFGGALFEVEGTKGLSVCDARFSYGCFHEFLGRAIAAMGLGAVRSLNETCFQALGSNSLACQHGIGHGVQAYLGYTFEDLEKGLAVCRDLPYNDPIGGCFGGVFMEYNVRTMLAEQATPRKYTGNPAEPCDTVDEAYVGACLFWQPQWWHQELFHANANAETFRRLGEMCMSSAPNVGTRRNCFEGIGNIIPQAVGFAPKKAASLCDATGDSIGRLFCLSFAANNIGISTNTETGRAVCEGLSSESKKFCIAYAENRANPLVALNPPKEL